MEWYAGSIVEAIQSAKSSQAYFVVYVEGSDDASKTTSEVLNKPTVAAKLNGKEFVCIKLLKDSEGHQQFAVIYKMVPVPSVFFIAPQTGLATDVVVGRTDAAEVEKKILETVEKSLNSQKLEGRGATPPVTVNATVNPPAGAASAAHPQPSPSSSRDSVSPARSDVLREATPPSEPQTSSNGNGPSIDEKVEKAKQLIAQQSDQKQKEELEKAKASERERRRVGQEIHKAKLSRQEQEMREALEERKKNSVEEAAARKKILDQIAQDRADRIERERMRSAGTAQAPSSVAASAPLAPQPINADSARIQFRLPSGESKTHVFPSDATLTHVRQFIDNNIVLPFSEYQLATTFPRREFTWRDNEQDLRALQLLPSAVLLVLPLSGSVVARPNGWATAMITLFWSLVTPIMNLGNYVTSFIFGGGRGPTPAAEPSSSSQDSQRQSGSASAPQPSQQAPYGSRTTIRKRGNIHTLSDDSENKDDNNTWNGNSTQQM